MSKTATELTVQRLKNESADKSVSPVVPREAVMGKDAAGAWRVISVNTSGEAIVNVS